MGYQEIRVYFKIDGDISDEQKEELVRMGEKYSPVTNTIKNLSTGFGAIGKIMTLVEMSRASIFYMRHLHPKEYRRNLFVP